MEIMPPVLQQAVRDFRVKHYPKGQIILYQGDEAHEIIVLKEGLIKLYDIDEQGNEKILHLVKPFGLVPFAFFSGGSDTIQWFHSALTDCDVWVLTADELTGMLKANSELAVVLMNWFSLEVHELLVRLSSLGKTNARDKVIAALKFFAVHTAERRRGNWLRVTFPVNHQLIADMTGVTRESAATIMKELADRHIVRNPRQTLLEINLDKLIALSLANQF